MLTSQISFHPQISSVVWLTDNEDTGHNIHNFPFDCSPLHAQVEKVKVVETHEEVRQGLKVLQMERDELLEDNQRMASMLASSEGDRKEVANVLDRLAEERKNFQRQCKQFRDKGESSEGREMGEFQSILACL